MEQRAIIPPSVHLPATEADYFKVERESPLRHEYRNGRIIAMVGGQEHHSLIGSNILGEVRHRLKGSPCRAYNPDLRVLSRPTGGYSYPDVTVICRPSQFGEGPADRLTVVNPRLIVEVLSPSTEADDRGAKFDGYRAIDSFEQYVLVAQDQPYVQTFQRQPGGGWLMLPYVGLDGTVPLASLGIELPMAEIYAGVTFPPPAVPA